MQTMPKPAPKKGNSEFAIFDRCQIVPGLFQVAERNRDISHLETKFLLGEYRVTVAGRPMTAFDVLLLCVVLNKLKQEDNPCRIEIGAKTTHTVGKALRDDLKLDGVSIRQNTLAYSCTYRQIIEEMGHKWAGKKSVEDINDFLWRAMSVAFRIEHGKRIECFHLISWAKGEDEEEGKIIINLNTRLTHILFHPGNFAKIMLDTMKKLQENECLMYFYLCGLVGSTGKVFTPAFTRSLIYGKQVPKNIKTRYSQEFRAIACLIKTVNSLDGWTITKVKEGWLVKREEDIRAPKKRKTKIVETTARALPAAPSQ